MSKLKNLKRTLGNRYIFEKHLTEKQIRELQNEKPKDFTDMSAVSMTAGCVKIEAVLYKTYDEIGLAYDVFVKDTPDSSEWICYDNPTDPISLKERELFAILDRIVENNELSYTECNFEIVQGKKKHKNKSDVCDL